MKNLDIKKLLVFIVIVAAIALVVFFVVKKVKDSKPTEDETKIAEELIADYYSTMTAGFTTQYGGIDILYNADKITYEDLSYASILNVANKYASDKGYNTGITNSVIQKLNAMGTYGNLDSAAIFTGTDIRKAIKELFGKEVEDQNAANNYDFRYDFYYNAEYDVYIMKENDLKDYTTPNEYMDYTVVETTKEKDKLKTTIAIAYVYNDGTNTNYYKDRNGENVIAENVTEFPKDKVNEFDKYTFTLAKTEDNNYVFESIEKITK